LLFLDPKVFDLLCPETTLDPIVSFKEAKEDDCFTLTLGKLNSD
jgi:hypothetical protein